MRTKINKKIANNYISIEYDFKKYPQHLNLQLIKRIFEFIIESKREFKKMPIEIS